ncbi:MAG: tetratricopeptide repeat protein [Verrucomicrobia bacterium]|nr:tetratricopeptide repeat protein [Verrucomicrobiota bacterium]
MLAIKTKHYFSMTLLVLCLVTLVSSQGQNSFLDPKISEAFWNSPQFQKQFLASYGVRSNVEPRFENPEEQIFYSQLGDTIRDQPQEAIKKITQQLNASSSAILSYTLGSLFFQEGQYQEAIKHYEVALSQFPDYLRAHKNLGIALIREERFGDSITHLVETINLGGADGTVYGLLGNAYLNLEKYASARLAYQNATLLDAENPLWELGIIKCAIATERYQEAVSLLDGVLSKQPDNAALWALQGNVYLQMEESDKAAVNFEILRKSGKATLQHLMLLGDIYMLSESIDLALAVYLEAIEQDGKGDIRRSLNAARILLNQGAWEPASAMFTKIRQAHEPTHGTVPPRVLEQIIEKNPLDAEALLLAGDFYMQAEDFEKALFRFEMVARIPGSESDGWVKQATVLVKQQQYTRAIELLEKAQKSNPRDNIQKFLDSVKRVANAATS